MTVNKKSGILRRCVFAMDRRAERDRVAGMKNETHEARCARIDRLRQSTINRLMARRERIERRAAPMIGELVRGGATVFYAFPAGGRYFESQSHTAVVDYLANNGWIN
jgi:hypothetical protein